MTFHDTYQVALKALYQNLSGWKNLYIWQLMHLVFEKLSESTVEFPFTYSTGNSWAFVRIRHMSQI